MTLALMGATVVDGTGAPGYSGTVLVQDGKVVSITHDAPPSDAEIVDLTGLVLAPGFIDPHTHLDCQILWDSELEPSCWHGVTTVVMGNCGFTIAPTRPEDRDTVLQTLENVEGMSLPVLRKGVDWCFETFPEYLDAIDRRDKRINVGALIGHTALRLYVMGAESTQRGATKAEVAAMRQIVGEAMEAGAMGFSTSKSPVHIGAYGAPIPSRLADWDEISTISTALRDFEAGSITLATGPDFAAHECAELSVLTGRPVTWLGLATGVLGSPGAALAAVAAADEMAGQSVPQISCRPLTAQLTLQSHIILNQFSEAFADLPPLPLAEQLELLRSRQWRDRVRATMKASWQQRLPQITLAETVVHTALCGLSLAKIAEGRGGDALDALIDLSLEENLGTRFGVVLANGDPDELGDMVADDRCLIGLSDAGAHVDQLCDAVYPTYLLAHWVRDRQRLTLEHAINKLTDQPARLFDIKGRGRIAPGYHADLVAFDPATVGPKSLRRVWDLPAGGERLIGGSTGISDIWVNGTAIRRSGQDIDRVYPGTLVTAGRN